MDTGAPKRSFYHNHTLHLVVKKVKCDCRCKVGHSELIPRRDIEQRIFLIRGHKVMIDRDLAELYQVPTKALNQAVKRNRDRFPDGFMFHLTRLETQELVTNSDRFTSLKHASGYPSVFTEYGVAMLSSVLRSKRAVHVLCFAKHKTRYVAAAVVWPRVEKARQILAQKPSDDGLFEEHHSTATLKAFVIRNEAMVPGRMPRPCAALQQETAISI